MTESPSAITAFGRLLKIALVSVAPNEDRNSGALTLVAAGLCALGLLGGVGSERGCRLICNPLNGRRSRVRRLFL